MSRPYTMQLPTIPNFGDKITIKGKLNENAESFSINLCVDSCPCPENIAFHFKTVLKDNKVVFNTKMQIWKEEIVDENTWVNGPGSNFVLRLLLSKDYIYVYDHQSFHYKFTNVHDINLIKSLQIWGDVEYITECSLQYMPKDSRELYD